jgi:Niemann-Pick C1 protein
MEAYLPII